MNLKGLWFKFSGRLRPVEEKETEEGLVSLAKGDKEESHIRSILFVIILVIFVLSVIGIFLFKFLFPSSVSQKAEMPTIVETNELFVKAEKYEIENLECGCAKARTYQFYEVELASTTAEYIVNTCLDASEGNSLQGLCLNIPESLSQKWLRSSVGGGQLMSNQEFDLNLDYDFYEACWTALYDIDSFRYTLIPYFEALGINASVLGEGGEADEFTTNVEEAFDQQEACELGVQNFTRNYELYFEECKVERCTYQVDQGPLDVIMQSVAVAGTLWGILLTVATITYKITLSLQNRKELMKAAMDEVGLDTVE